MGEIDNRSLLVQFSSVQFSCSVVSNSLWPHELQYTRPPCPSPTPGVHPNSCPLSQYAIQPSHPLSSPSPPASNPSQHQSLSAINNRIHVSLSILFSSGYMPRRGIAGSSGGFILSFLRNIHMHWRRKWQPTPVFLPGESQGRGSLVGCCLWGRTESDTTEAT